MPYYLSPKLVAALNKRTGGQPLFPRLQFLAWQRSNFEKQAGTQLLQLLTPPRLSVVVLWHPHTGDPNVEYQGSLDLEGLPSDIETITTRAPRLQHFLSELEFPSQALHKLENCPDLRSLTVRTGTVQLPFFAHISTLTRLEELVVIAQARRSSEGDEDIPEESAEFSPEGFAALKNLRLEQSDITLVNETLTTISSISSNVSLSSISIDFLNSRHSDGDQETVQVIKVLSSPRLAHALRGVALRLDYHYFHRRDKLSPLLFSQFAEPLFHVPTIEDFSLKVQGRHTVLSDQDVAQIARAWPNITYIHITNERENSSLGQAQCPSFGSVVSFAQQCHRLEALAINVADVTEEELEELERRAQAESPAPRHTLSLLLPAASTNEWKHIAIYDIERLALALRTMFPRIGGTRSMGRDHPFLKRVQLEWQLQVRREGPIVYDLLAKLDVLREEVLCK